jgi:hypothetical protein
MVIRGSGEAFYRCRPGDGAPPRGEHSRPAAETAASAQGGGVAAASTAMPDTGAVPSDARAETGTTYFPSQYRLDAGPPEDHVEAF